MWVPSSSDRFFFDFRRALLPISLGLLLLIHFTFHPSLAVMVLLCTLFPIYLVMERIWLQRAVQGFERECTRFLQQDDPRGLRALIERSRLLGLLGPPGFMDEKRGLLALLDKDWVGAEQYLERAYLRAPKSARQALLPSILRAKYETGNWAEAEQIARSLVGRTPFPTCAELFLGLILCRREGDRVEAIRLLEQAAEVAGDQDKLRVERALAELKA